MDIYNAALVRRKYPANTLLSYFTQFGPPLSAAQFLSFPLLHLSIYLFDPEENYHLCSINSGLWRKTIIGQGCWKGLKIGNKPFREPFFIRAVPNIFSAQTVCESSFSWRWCSKLDVGPTILIAKILPLCSLPLSLSLSHLFSSLRIGVGFVHSCSISPIVEKKRIRELYDSLIVGLFSFFFGQTRSYFACPDNSTGKTASNVINPLLLSSNSNSSLSVICNICIYIFRNWLNSLA